MDLYLLFTFIGWGLGLLGGFIVFSLISKK
jgi:hypothetical protein